MLKNFIKFSTVTILLLAPTVSFAQVSKIVFITEPQVVVPGEKSGAIKIQFQNSSGNAEPAGETLKMTFDSSSDTGEFLNESGNPVSTTVQSSWTSRTFYYKDQTEGTFTMTVGILGKDWIASQKIIISSNADASGEVLAANTGSGSDDSAAALSATSGAAEPTYATAASKLEVSAGGDRLTSPGSPISFQAEIKKNSASNSAVGFSWSFGDGYVGEGALVSHTYRYPGEYAVVLNSKAGNNFSVSRLKVRVIEPDLTLIRAEPGQGDFIEIANNSAYELNLFNWKIVDNHLGFVFQPDTIILPKSKLRFDHSLLKMRGEAEENLVLKNHLGQVVASAPKKMSESELKEIAAKTVDVQEQTYELAEKVRIMSPALAVQTKITEKTVPEEKAEEAPSEPENNLLYEAPKSEGIFVRLTNFVKRVIFR